MSKLVKKLLMPAVLALAVLYVFAAFYNGWNFKEPQNAAESREAERALMTAPAESADAGETLSTAPEDSPVINPAPSGSTGSFSVLACGDDLIHERIIRWANILAGGTGEKSDYAKTGFSFLPIYEKVAPFIESADLALISQNSLVGSNDSPESLSGYPLFNSPSQLGRDLKTLGFDLVNMANNHEMDLGENALLASLDFWDSIGMNSVGAYRSESEFLDTRARILGINGVRCAVLSYTEHTNGLYPASGGAYIPYFCSQKNGEDRAVYKELLTEQVKKCRDEADCVIVLIFWGTESAFDVSSRQAETAQILCDAGADVIIGSGPKVIQKIEWLENSSGGKTLCAYSLGNFLCTMEYTENLFGGMLGFDVRKTEEGKCRIENAVFIPTVIHYDEKGENIRVIPLSAYSEEEFRRHGSILKNGADDFARYRRILAACVPKEMLPALLRA